MLVASVGMRAGHKRRRNGFQCEQYKHHKQQPIPPPPQQSIFTGDGVLPQQAPGLPWATKFPTIFFGYLFYFLGELKSPP